MREHSQRGARAVHESGAIRTYVDSDYDVGAEVPGVTNRKVRDQTAINQQPAFGVAYRCIEGGQTVACAKSKRQVARVAHHDCGARLKIGSQCGEGNPQIFEARYRQAGAQKFFHWRI